MTDGVAAQGDIEGGGRQALKELSRAFGGALLFSLPMFLTMEMWWLGFYLERLRLIVLLVLTFPVLVGLSHFRGLESTFGWREDLLHACIAYGVGFLTAAVLLPLFAIVRPGMSLEEIAGKIAIQAIPGSIGALLARSQLGGQQDKPQRRREPETYGSQLFFALAGSVYLALTLAPTQEMTLLAQRVTWWQVIALLAMSLAVMQGFTYAIARRRAPLDRVPLWSSFVRYTVVSFAIALLVSVFMLWAFSRSDGLALEQLVREMLVLGFPAGVGAGASRVML